MNAQQLEAEVDANFDMILDHMKALLPDHDGQYVLIRHQQLAGFYAGESDALAAGRDRFSDGIYSVQEVTDRPVDLGFFSHAVNSRIA